MEIIISHTNADFDSFASMVAAQKVYPDAKIVLAGAQNRNVREFLTLHDDVIRTYDARQIDKKAVSRLIIVDTKIGRRLGELQDLAYMPGVEVFTFDHHPATPEDVPITRDFSEEVGATITILTKIIRDKGISITPFEATLFALGVHEDTGSLTYKTTTYDDASALAFLMANKANIDMIHRFLNPALAPDQHALFDILLHASKVIEINNVSVMITRADVDEYVEGGSIVVHKLADVENVEAIFALLNQGNRVYLIGRSRTDAIDVGKILEEFGGGGHAQAASAVIKGISNADDVEDKIIEDKLIKALFANIKQPLVAKQIMSSPVRLIESDLSIKEANKLMIKYGYSGLPVVENGKLVGLIGRREIDKAAHHGLSHAPVKGFMTRRIQPIPPEMPLPEIQKLLSDENLGRVPVVENDLIVGIISRTDILKAMGGLDYFSRSQGSKAMKPQYTRGEIAQKIKTTLPSELQRILREVGDIANLTGFSAFLVGGIVRDLLLNNKNLDVDIVIEGDAVEFAAILVEKLGGKIRAHQKFGTAVVILPSGFRIDFASARAEFYEKPAVLPQVEPTSIKQDLARRDFTINAMAISLNTKDYGKLLDYFNGQRDLRYGRIRILHNLSFIEDPTRIFRAARFEQRLGFRMETETEELLRKAIDMDLIEQLSGSRVRDELMLILSEEKPYRILKRLSDLGALKIAGIGTAINEEIEQLFRKVDDAISELDFNFPAGIQRRLVYLAVILKDMKKKAIVSWCERMKLRKTETARLLEMACEVPKVIDEFNKAARLKNSRIYELLQPMSPEALVFAHAVSANLKVQKIIHLYLSRLRGTKVSVNGRNLQRMGFPPSPIYNIILRGLLIAKLDGKVGTLEDEERFVIEHFGQFRTNSAG
ncbi:MAG: CBS domain-containing protein [Actinomycetota bacterium]|nr:CBS domain-containing protein [Actinomycetota bacterium]